jgi:hypothetical protein
MLPDIQAQFSNHIVSSLQQFVMRIRFFELSRADVFSRTTIKKFIVSRVHRRQKHICSELQDDGWADLKDVLTIMVF